MKSSAWNTTGYATTMMMATSAAMVANETSSAARMRFQRWRTSHPTAGWSAIARMTPMTTQSTMVRIWKRNSMTPTMTSTVSVTIAVTRMIWEERHSLRGEHPARRRVLVAHVSPPRDVVPSPCGKAYH